MKAKDLMIQTSDCARVAEDRTIYDAVVLLEAWRQRNVARQALRERKADEAYQDWLRQVRDRAYVELRLEER